MIFLADENFDNDILRGVWRRAPDFSAIRIQDTEIIGADDRDVLAYAAANHYTLLTHDVNTMRGFFYERVEAKLPVPGVFLVHKQTPIGNVIDALELILLASDEDEWQGKITYVPFS